MSNSRTRSVAIVTGGAVLQMSLQLALQVLLAREFGASSVVDAYVAATTVPIVVAGMIGVPLGAVLIPILSRSRTAGGSESSAQAAGRIGLFVAAASVLLAGAFFLTAEIVIGVLYPGLSPADVELAARVLRIATWLIPANALTAWCQSIHHAEGRFLLPAAAGVVGPAVTVGLVVFADGIDGILRFAVALIAGGRRTWPSRFPV